MKPRWHPVVAFVALSVAAFACEDSATQDDHAPSASTTEKTTAFTAEATSQAERAATDGDVSPERTPPSEREQASEASPSHRNSAESAVQSEASQPEKAGSTASPTESSRRPDDKKAKGGSQREFGTPPDPTELTPQERENWRIMQALRQKHSYDDLRRAEEEIHREMKQRQAAVTGGKDVERPMGALVDERDPPSAAPEKSK